MEISLWKKPEKKQNKTKQKNPGDYQVKMKQKSYFRTEDTISKNSDKKKNLLKLRLQNPKTTRISQPMVPGEERVAYKRTKRTSEQAW
jgi:hypothetical protein